MDNQTASAAARGETRLSDIIYEKIVGMISDGRFPVNERLPSEQNLASLFGASRPVVREALERLPGGGRKTANVVLNVAFGHETFAVDTHIFRVGNRTGLAKGKTPEQVEAKLEKRVPQPFRLGAHHWLILHGRYVCKARTPECWRCAVVDLCSYRKKVLEKPGRGNTKTGPG